MISSNGRSTDKGFTGSMRDDGDGFKLEKEKAVFGLERDGLGKLGPGPSAKHQTKRKFYGARVSYDTSSSCQASFQVLNDAAIRILLSGDIHQNPGPVRNPCSVCKRAVASTHRALKCNTCNKKCHIRRKCGNIKPAAYLQLKNSEHREWMCPTCVGAQEHIIDRPLVTQHHDLSNTNTYDNLAKEINTKGLRVGHNNINGLLNKLHELKYLLQSVKFDIFAVSETHLSKEVKDEQIMIEGYCIARRDRQCSDNNWGGCLIYYAEDLNAFVRDDLKDSSNIEATWLDVTVSSQKILIGVVYRQPSDGSFYDKFQRVLEPICLRRTNILILGDFNADLFFQRGLQKDMSQGKKLLRILNSFNLYNVIDQPTRITETSETMIDLIITSITAKVKTSGCYNSGISDHHIVYAVMDLLRKRAKPITKEVKNYKNINTDAIKSDFEHAPWGVCKVFEEIDDVVWAWENLYKDIIGTHIKTRKAKIRSNSLPWMDRAIRREMNLHYKLLKDAQLNPNNAEKWGKYRKQRNHVTTLCRKKEAEYWKGRFEQADCAADFWKTVKSMQGKRKDTKIGHIKGENGQILLDDTEKASSLNHFLATVGEKLAANHQVVNVLTATSTLPLPKTISDIEINELKVQSVIKKKVKAGKAVDQTTFLLKILASLENL
eukprot:Seg2901.1 transcript_id=Seg2901.1/GoldUCD/mRNA.D3Y31 product="hypothetical protein" protein_id=Seg2901.1/GoldUCD/D3Y31